MQIIDSFQIIDPAIRNIQPMTAILIGVKLKINILKFNPIKWSSYNDMDFYLQCTM